jgi:hypothetical protein
MQVDSAPGPPRTSIVLARGHRVAVLDVGLGNDTGAIDLADHTRFTLERPPGSSEWWVTDRDGREVATLRRCTLIGERFAIRLEPARSGRSSWGRADQPEATGFEVVASGRPWRRRWEVRDAEGRGLIEVVQRRCARSVHDLHTRAGDLPAHLPMFVAWLLASVSHAPLSATRRSRWTTRSL